MQQIEMMGNEPAPKKARAACVPLYTCSLVRERSVQSETKIIIDSNSAAAIFRAVIGDADREHFAVAALDARRRCIGVQIVSVGTLSASLVHPREVFKPAIILNAAAVVVSHNHPSGDPTPSSGDRDATRRLQRAGEILGIPVADHVILAAENTDGGRDAGFFSFRDHGLL